MNKMNFHTKEELTGGIRVLLIDKLKKQENLTNTERRLANHILKNIESIPSMTIENLARQTYTSHSAVVRLSKKMDFDGFKDFRIALSKDVHSQLHTLGSVDANFPFSSSDSPIEIAKNMSDLTINTVKRAYAQLSNEVLLNATDLLSRADRIFLFARGDSQIRARSFQNKLIKVNKFSVIAEKYADEAWTAANLTSDDCAFFISYGGIVPQYEHILSYFYTENISTLVLTGNAESELNKLSSLSLITTQDEYDFLKVGTFSSQVAFEYILDTLFSILFAKEYQKNIDNLKNKQLVLQNELASEEHRKN